jgi:hypothetical protein
MILHVICVAGGELLVFFAINRALTETIREIVIIETKIMNLFFMVISKTEKF